MVVLYSLDTSHIQKMSSLSFDMSPSVLVPHYDPDISVVYLAAKVSITRRHLP